MPHTPPLQANGRSARVRWAASRIDWSFGIGAVVLRPSSTTVTLLVSPVDHRLGPVRAPAAARRRRTARSAPSRAAPRARSSTSRASAISPNGPHSHTWSTAPERDQGGEQSAQPVGVEPAREQLDVTRLARQHVHELEAGAVAVLQVGQLLGEHHRCWSSGCRRAASAASPGWRQHRRGDRQHRRDARPGGDAQVPAAVRGRAEAAAGRLHLDLVAGPHLVDQPLRRTRPPGSSRTPTRGRSPTGAQIE